VDLASTKYGCRKVWVILSLIVLLSTCLPARAIDPVSAAAISDTAIGVLKEFPSSVRWAGSLVRKVRKGDGSITQIVDIIPTTNNAAFFDINVECGYRIKTKLGRRYVKEVSVYYFDRKIASKRYANNEAERSKVVRLKSSDIIPRSDVEAALRAGKTELPITIKARANCETYNERKKRFRGKHSANPTDSTRVTLMLPAVSKESKRRNSANSSSKKKPSTSGKTKSGKAKRGKSKVKTSNLSKAPNLQIKVTNRAKLKQADECPRYVHFTGMIKFNSPGTYYYYFDADDGSKTSRKKLVTNGAGKKEFYWNRRIPINTKKMKSAKAQYGFKSSAKPGKAASLVKGWSRINVYFKQGKGSTKLYKSKPTKFALNCG